MSRERGSALLLALIALALLGAVGFSLVLVTDGDVLASGNVAGAHETLYAAEGALEIAAHELLVAPDWNAIFAGGVISGFADGAPSGSRRLNDGTEVNLTDLTQAARDQPRPWGANNPHWQIFAFGRLGPAAYVIAWVGDDPAENDGDPLQDGASEANPGSSVAMVRALAVGARGGRKVVEAIVRRVAGPDGTPSLQLLSWTEIR